MIKRFMLALVVLAGVMAVALPQARAQDAPIKVAFVYIGTVGEGGFTFSHDQGRLAVEEAFGDNVVTSFAESVPETPADAERVIRDFAEKGNKVIFTTSFGFMDPTIAVAKDYPDTVFIHISGYKTAENVGTLFGKIEEPRFVAGMIAGNMTESNVLGYVAAFPIPEVIRGINAYTLGARSVNPDVVVKVVWTNTWFDPQKEQQAAEALLDSGADIIAQHQDTTAPIQAAAAADAWAVGYHSDMAYAAPDNVLTSVIWNWGPAYVSVVQFVIDGTWTSTQDWFGWQDDIVGLTEINEAVPAEVVAAAEAEMELFKSGEKTITDIFSGPLNDNKGTEMVAEGASMTDEELLGMMWFVEGVEGEIPS